MRDDDTNDKAAEAGRAGSFFDDFLKEQGTYEATTEVAIKRVVAFQSGRSHEGTE